MEIKVKIEQTKARKKGFLKAMPEEQRRLLKLQERASSRSRHALFLIPIWFVLLLIEYPILSLLLPYERNWLWNGIAAGTLFLIGTVILIIIHVAQKRKAEAFSCTISDYVEEYREINKQLTSLKKAERTRAAAERKAERAEEKAQEAAYKAQAKSQEAQQYANDARAAVSEGLKNEAKES